MCKTYKTDDLKLAYLTKSLYKTLDYYNTIAIWYQMWYNLKDIMGWKTGSAFSILK